MKETRSIVNATDLLVATRAEADQFGGIGIWLSGGYRLQVLRDGSHEEVWRYIEIDGQHLVMEGNHARVE